MPSAAARRSTARVSAPSRRSSSLTAAAIPNISRLLRVRRRRRRRRLASAVHGGEHISVALVGGEQLAVRARSPPRGPSSSSTTMSAIAIVAGRWAITIVVRPCITVCIAARISCSFDGSTALVASSSTRIRGSATIALAIAIRWRWPPDSEYPRSPISVSYPSGSSTTKSWAPASRAAASMRVRSAVGSAKAMLAATVSWNSNVSSNTTPTARRTSWTATSRTSTPSISTVPRCGS